MTLPCCLGDVGIARKRDRSRQLAAALEWLSPRRVTNAAPKPCQAPKPPKPNKTSHIHCACLFSEPAIIKLIEKQKAARLQPRRLFCFHSGSSRRASR